MNVQHRTSNVQVSEDSDTEHLTTAGGGFFSAVLILVIYIELRSLRSSLNI